MNEEPTRNLPHSKSFEERVFARFDAADARFDSIDVRLEKLESRSYDTKPIWERALKEILETRLEVGELKKQIGAVEKKTDAIETRLGTVEGEVTGLRSDYAGLHNELVETQRDFKMKLTRRLDLVLTTLVDTRDSLRDADERLTHLESKLA
jgi:chromosome segregation ATPase